MKKIIWSPLAELAYYETLLFILENWDLKTADNFDRKVRTLLDNLKKYDQICPASEKKADLRRCVISKQTSLIYRIKEDVIEIVEFADNRADSR